ncbi:hypothetical protein BD779DRAFT_1484601 [Infundibulicybe gibba]|nr:hypothetical protein BD779DRAFT_1484601 [Infundibulicybe gibba]
MVASWAGRIIHISRRFSSSLIVPTPLVFVSASSWDKSTLGWFGATSVSRILSEKGFTCLECDLAPPSRVHIHTSQELMSHFESELRSTIRTCSIPFPPIIFAHSSACIIAQTYISSNPATGLFMISPPISNTSLPETQLPTRLKEFDYEPKFPIAIMATAAEMNVIQNQSRLGKEPDVDKIVVTDIEGRQALQEVENWLDGLGV